jgi:1,4-alpha-glucan branching enzyme
MGAIPYDGGTTFRVWAPNAQQVFVAGDFNGWQPTEIGNEFNGNFSGDIAGAKPGQGYKFLIRHGNDWIWRADPRAQQMSNSTGNSIIHDRNSYQWQHDLDFKMPPKNQTVMYEMNVDTYQSFFGGHGNWNSAIDKLQHLKDLGINMIELMPSAEFPGDVSWGYNPADPFAPESAFGSPDDMKHFIDLAHSMGIGVTLDVVYNHFGPSDLSMWDFDGTGYPGDGGIYFYNDWKQQTPWGPRPNYGRKEVQDYIVDNAMQWLGEYHLDGLRLDATSQIRSASGADNPDGWNVLKRINDQAHAQWPWKRIIAEDNQNVAAITQKSGAGFDQQWDPSFFNPVDDSVEKANDSWIDMNEVKDAILHTMDGNPFDRVVYSQSHDEVANGKSYIESMVDPSNPGSYYAKKKQTLAAALALTSAGTPMLFQGQEFNEPGSFAAENPLNWNNLKYFSGINQMYTDLIHLRRNWNNNTQGLSGANTNVFHVDNNNKVIAYQRWDKGGPGDDTIVIVNMSSKPMKNYDIGLPSGGDWKVRFNSDWQGYSPDFGGTSTFDVGAQGGGMDGLNNHGSLNIGAYSVVILSKDR